MQIVTKRIGVDAPAERLIDRKNFKVNQDQLDLLEAQSYAPTHESIESYDQIRGE